PGVASGLGLPRQSLLAGLMALAESICALALVAGLGIGQHAQVDTVDRAGRQAQRATGALVADHRVHLARGPDDGAHRAGMDALGAADARRCAKEGDLRRYRRLSERQLRHPEQFGQRLYRGLAARRKLVDGLATRDALGVGQAAGVPAL